MFILLRLGLVGRLRLVLFLLLLLFLLVLFLLLLLLALLLLLLLDFLNLLFHEIEVELRVGILRIAGQGPLIRLQ